MNRTWIQIGSILAFVGVALGALGAHALKATLGSNREYWETGVQYQLFHAISVLFVASIATGLPEKTAQRITTLFAAGILLFSGSLYVLALTNILVLGAITPFGGLCFLAGWAYLCVAASSKRGSGSSTKEPIA